MALHRLVCARNRLRGGLGKGAHAKLVLRPPGMSQRMATRAARAAVTLHRSHRLAALSDEDRVLMRSELGAFLDHHPHARSVLPALVLVERSLRITGGLDRLPTDVVDDASALLARLAGGCGADGIARLRVRLRQLGAARSASLRAAG